MNSDHSPKTNTLSAKRKDYESSSSSMGGQMMDINETFLICFHIGFLYNDL